MPQPAEQRAVDGLSLGKKSPRSTHLRTPFSTSGHGSPRRTNLKLVLATFALRIWDCRPGEGSPSASLGQLPLHESLGRTAVAFFGGVGAFVHWLERATPCAERRERGQCVHALVSFRVLGVLRALVWPVGVCSSWRCAGGSVAFGGRWNIWC